MDKFVPNIYQRSIFTIDYEKLKKSGIKCLLFDLDNTIVPIHIKEPEKKVKDLFEELKDKEFKIIILSNSPKKRVAPFKDILNVDAAHSSKKPLKGKYQKIMKVYEYKDTQIAAIGDQLFTDILGANRMEFTSILVNPISKNDIFPTTINRYFEKKLMNHLNKKGLFEIGKYYD